MIRLLNFLSDFAELGLILIGAIGLTLLLIGIYGG